MSVIQDMIDAAPSQVASTQKSIDQIQASIDVFQAKQDAMETDVGNVTATNLETYLIGTKFSPAANYYMYKGTNFNNILVSSGNITDWKVYENIVLTNLIYFNNSTFECFGDQTLTFPISKDLSFLLGSTRVYSTVSSSSLVSETISDLPTSTQLTLATHAVDGSTPEERLANVLQITAELTPGVWTNVVYTAVSSATPAVITIVAPGAGIVAVNYKIVLNKTSVVLNTAVLTASLTSAWSLHYVYNSGDDAIIDNHKVNWDFTQDYIIHPVGLTGTYGTQNNIELLTDSIGLLDINKTKINDSIAIFSQFVP